MKDNKEFYELIPIAGTNEIFWTEFVLAYYTKKGDRKVVLLRYPAHHRTMRKFKYYRKIFFN